MVPARIRVSSTIENLDSYGLVEGEREETSGVYPGLYEYVGGRVRLEYDESGEGGNVKTVIGIDGVKMTVERHGAVESRFEFEEGRVHESVYSVVPYSFDATVKARRIRTECTEDGGRIDLLYNMRIGGQDKAVRMKIWILLNSSRL